MEGKIKYLNKLNQDKHYVLMGNLGSGKTILAKEMAKVLVEPNEVVFINDSNGRFKFSECNENTKLVIFDDVKNLEDYIYHTEGLVVDKKGKKSFFITPKIILISDIVKNVSKSIDRRFNLIELL